MLRCLILFFMFHLVSSNIYLHNPRGTNNRHNENSRERQNSNLNFDSQNNQRGGYNVGEGGIMYYYTKSILPIQWTNQHSCDDVNGDCVILLQYTCSDTLRDGQTTNTIPLTADAELDPQYRRTEDLQSYLHCRVRSRNENLFTADQKLQGASSISTRQNPRGTRYGYECPEEHDYYPHWQPNAWIDIAILTNRQDRCSYYQSNSPNVQSRFACTFTNLDALIRASDLQIILPNDQAACETFNDTRLGDIQPEWIEYPSHQTPPPECYAPPHSRANHLGDIRGSEMATFNWTLPDLPAKKCVLRIRYNISSNDFDGWNTDASRNDNLILMPEYFEDETVASTRGYRFQNDPAVQLFEDIDFKLELAVNTAQYSRVFQDRSFIFEMRQRPVGYEDLPIYNLNVRGRRGNIHQVFPSVEYDFVPSRLEISPNSLIHIQWIGSNTTPNGDGQGRPSTDRTNLLLLKNRIIDSNWTPYDYLNATGLLNSNLPAQLAESDFLNFPLSDRRRLAASGTYTDEQLNNASPYFDLGARLIGGNLTGVYNYLSTRNNDFSNRVQKGQIIVQPYRFTYQLLGRSAYTAKLEQTLIRFPESSLNTTVTIKYAKLTPNQFREIFPKDAQMVEAKEKLYGNVYFLQPYDLQFHQYIQFQIPLEEFDGQEKNIDILRFEPHQDIYSTLPYTLDYNNSLLNFQSNFAGIYLFSEKHLTSSTTAVSTDTTDFTSISSETSYSTTDQMNVTTSSPEKPTDQNKTLIIVLSTTIPLLLICLIIIIVVICMKRSKSGNGSFSWKNLTRKDETKGDYKLDILMDDEKLE